jgi:hypothetical protein
MGEAELDALMAKTSGVGSRGEFELFNADFRVG